MILAKSSGAAFTHNLQIHNIFLIENAEHLRYTMFRFTGKETGRMMLNNCMMDVDDLIFDGQEQAHSER